MHYVWQHRLFAAKPLRTVDGRRLEIINPGIYNTDAGPDFFNATIIIDGQTWVGNIEIHLRASDWYRHHHDTDCAYDSVILHVVDADDTIVRRPDGAIIPQFRLPCSPTLNADYTSLTSPAPGDLPCADSIRTLPKLYLTDWISALAYERVQQKADRIETIRQHAAGSWDEAAFITVARSLGAGKNSEPFERLARITPLRILRKHTNSPFSLEALLFGQAGLLPDSPSPDSYAAKLRDEYTFLATKYDLHPMQKEGWKMGRMRPLSLPYRRIALLATIVASTPHLLDSICSATSLDRVKSLFCKPLSQFWLNHYSFTTAGTDIPQVLGRASIELLMINAVIPLTYAFNMYIGQYEASTQAVEMLHKVNSEANSIVTLFATAGIKSKTAFTSQALIQLRRQYCEPRKCLYCRIGHRYLSSRAIRPC